MEENEEEEVWTQTNYGNPWRRNTRKLYSTVVRSGVPLDSRFQRNNNYSSRRNFEEPQQRREKMYKYRGNRQFNSERYIERHPVTRHQPRIQQETNMDTENQQRGRRYFRNDQRDLRKRNLLRRPTFYATNRNDGRVRHTEQNRGWWRSEQRPLNAARSNMDIRENEARTDFTNQVRLFYKMIKSCHHLKNITQNQTPKAIGKITQHLINTIKPAMPTDLTLDLIQGNARNWELTTIIILSNHYKEIIETLTSDLQTITMDDWIDAFEVAANWARRRLGRRLLHESVQEAERKINTTWTNRETNEQHRGTEEPPQAQRLCTAGVQTEENKRPPPPGKGIMVTAQIHRTRSSSGDIIHSPIEDLQEQGSMGLDQLQRNSTAIAGTPDSPMEQRIRQRVSGEYDRTSEVAGSRPRMNRQKYGVILEDDASFVLTSDSMVEEIQASPREQRGGRRNTQEDAVLPESGGSGPADDEERARTGIKNGPFLTTGPARYGGQGMNRPDSRNRSQQTDELDWSPSATRLVGRSPWFRPTRHAATDRKKRDWSVDIREKFVILGDSNVAKIPPFNLPDLQIESFPGATFRHIHMLLEAVDVKPEVQRILFSLGINNRKQKLQTTVKEIQRLYKMACEKFPNAEIYFPLLNFARNLPFEEQEFLQNLNKHLKSKYRTLTELARTEFFTERDRIHWTHKTAQCMFNHWVEQGNQLTPLTW